jgi:photosystem II stability/assembly factor-like uncharacterized protein
LGTGSIELALAPSNPSVVYASVAQTDGNRIQGLYRTDNAWDDVPTWRQISIAGTAVDINNFVPGTYCTLCSYAHVLSVSPSDPNIVFAGGKALLWRCMNCGSAPQWTLANKTDTDTFADQHTIAWAGGRLILGNDGGIFSTTDLGATWQNHNATISTVMFYNGALHPTDPGFMIAGARDHGMTIRRGGSPVWVSTPRPQNANEFGGEGEVALSSKHPETDWMASTVGAAVWRTIDGGRTVAEVDAGFDKTGGYNYPTPVRKCPSNDDVFLAGTSRLYRTDDFFSSTTPSWSQNGSPGATTNTAIAAVAFAPADTTCGTYAYGTGSRGIWLTRDGGKTWTELDPGLTLPARTINAIAFDPTNSNIIYLAFTSFNTANQGTQNRHVYKTTNASATPPTWTNISPPEDVPFDAITVDPRNPSLVYAGSDTGLWVSGDGGAMWQKVGPDRGLPHAAVYDVEINPATNLTVVFTHGRGAFRLNTE